MTGFISSGEVFICVASGQPEAVNNWIWRMSTSGKIPLISFLCDTQRVNLPHDSCRSTLTPPTSHALLWVGREVSGNTCRDYSLTNCDASSPGHSLTWLPVGWWQLPTHLFTMGWHFLCGCCAGFLWTVRSARPRSECGFYWLMICVQMFLW